MTVMQMVYRAPAIAATMAVMAGASPHLAYHLNSLVSVALMGEAQDILAEFGIQPFADGEELLWLPGGFAENNWAFLAEHSGAALDVAGWQEAMLERNRAIQAGEVGFDAA